MNHDHDHLMHTDPAYRKTYQRTLAYQAEQLDKATAELGQQIAAPFKRLALWLTTRVLT